MVTRGMGRVERDEKLQVGGRRLDEWFDQTGEAEGWERSAAMAWWWWWSMPDRVVACKGGRMVLARCLGSYLSNLGT